MHIAPFSKRVLTKLTVPSAIALMQPPLTNKKIIAYDAKFDMVNFLQ
jgi:hypothetical protein